MRNSRISLALLSLVLAGCAQLQPMVKREEVLTKPLVIDRVKLNQKIIDLSKEEQVIIEYRLSQPADIKVEFFNSINTVVKTIEYPQIEAGINKIYWDGKTDSGQFCESDVYTYIIVAKSRERVFTYNPAVNTGGKDLTIEKQSIDPETGKITYVLPKSAWVRIRLGITESALLKTLQDWQPEEAGRHEKEWDGWDKNNTMNLLNDKRLGISVQAISHPMNSVIIKGMAQLNPYDRYNKIISGRVKSYPMPINAMIYLREPEFSIKLVKEYPMTEKGLPIISGIVPVTVTLNEKDKDILTNSRYELMFYVDTIFIYEDEQAYSPFTYMWETKGLGKGEHIFTVNLLGYNRTVGIESIKVYVK